MAKTKKLTKAAIKKLDTELLQRILGEMNDVMGCDPELDVELDDNEEIIALIKDNLVNEDGEVEIYTTDEFSDEAWVLFGKLGVEAVGPPNEDAEAEEEPEEEEKPAPKKKKKAPAKKEKKTKKAPAKKEKKEKKAAKPKKKAAPKKEKKKKEPAKPRYTRMTAVAEAIKEADDVTVENLVSMADDNYVNNGGNSSEKESKWYVNHALTLCVALSVVEIEDGNVTYNG